jgi:hypothetical protein
MGGPGFFGLRLSDEWLIVAVWNAASWIQVDGRIVEDTFWEKNGWPRPWISDRGDELTEAVVGQPVSRFEVTRKSLLIGIGTRTLSISESPEGRPIHEGSKEPRSFLNTDDLTRAVFLSPTTELWI